MDSLFPYIDPKFAQQVDGLLLKSEPDTTYKRMSTWADNDIS
jgi:hypothetical protein